jgi:copper transport protein
VKVLEWKASAELPSQGIDKVDIPMLPLTDNHAAGSIQLPTPGNWTFTFTARTSDIDQVTVTQTIRIRP